MFGCGINVVTSIGIFDHKARQPILSDLFSGSVGKPGVIVSGSRYVSLVCCY